MAGEAKTKEFMLTTGTVMLGPQDELFELNPTEHSIGLVKDFVASAEPEYTELKQGVKNNIVDSTQTGNTVRASMSVYEFTAKNLRYSVGLSGGAFTQGDWYPVDALVAASATTVELTDAVDNSADFIAGKWIQIQENDNVHLSPIVSASHLTGVTTVTFSRPLSAGNSFTTAARVSLVNIIEVGSKENQPYFAAKVVGVLPSGEPVTILIPSLRITKGFNIGMTTDYGSMPFEFTVYEPVTSDPFYADIKVPMYFLKR